MDFNEEAYDVILLHSGKSTTVTMTTTTGWSVEMRFSAEVSCFLVMWFSISHPL